MNTTATRRAFIKLTADGCLALVNAEDIVAVIGEVRGTSTVWFRSGQRLCVNESVDAVLERMAATVSV